MTASVRSTLRRRINHTINQDNWARKYSPREATLKFEGSIILQLQGRGPVKLIVVECTSEQTLRATAKWDEERYGELQPEASLGDLMGHNGRFVITLVPPEGKQSYQGVVEIDPADVKVARALGLRLHAEAA